MYCPKCGKQIDEASRFCQECGYSINNNSNNNYSYNYNQSYNNYYEKTPSQILAEREKIAFVVWIVIASLQAVTAIFAYNSLNWLGELLDVDLSMGSIFEIAVSGFNFYGAYCSYQRGQKVKAKMRGIVAEYDNLLVLSIIFIIVNVIFGGIFGVAGAIFDLVNRSYAITNARYLER